MLKFAALASALLAASAAPAVTISWTDWTVEEAASMTGTITAPGGTVTVTYTGPLQSTASQTTCGTSWWGSGTPVLNGAGTGFFGSGEVHGIIRLPGTFTSITFIDTSENWHGFTAGIADVAGPVIPEPATWAMLVAGFGMVGASIRRRNAATA